MIFSVVGFGTPEDVGDVDFYPGGGDPPGCEQTIARSISEDLPTEGSFVFYNLFLRYFKKILV